MDMITELESEGNLAQIAAYHEWEDEFFVWTRWLAWYPVNVRGKWRWFRWIEYRRIMFGAWVHDPVYRYRERKQS